MKPLCCLLAVLSLGSCAQVEHLTSATTGGLAKATDATKESFAKLMPSRIPVVEVREKDLKKLPTGEEQAVAFERTRRNRFWGMFSGPVDFQEPSLPDDAGAMDAGLLPPRVE